MVARIDNGVATEFASGQGATARVVTKFPAVALGGKDSRMTMTTTSGSHTLAVVAERRICQSGGQHDDPVGDRHARRAPVSGCGRMLVSESPDSKYLICCLFNAELRRTGSTSRLRRALAATAANEVDADVRRGN